MQYFRSIFGLILLFVSMLGCAATVPLTPEHIDSQGKNFNPPFSKGNLYIVRPSTLLAKGTLFRVVVDGKIQGAVAQGTYLLIELSPGPHSISVTTDKSTGMTKVDVRAGKNYFVEVKLTGGVGWFTSDLQKVAVANIGEQDGRSLVLEAKRAQHFTAD